MNGALTTVVGYDDRDAWNGFVRDHPSGHFFQTWDWGVLQDRIGGVPQREANESLAALKRLLED